MRSSAVKPLIAAAMALMVLFVVAKSENEILGAVEHSLEYRHHGPRVAAIESAWRDCDSDSNMFCRVLLQVAASHSNFVSMAAEYVGKYGSTNDVDSLYLMLGPDRFNNVKVHRALLEIGGVSDRILASVSNSYPTVVAEKFEFSRTVAWLSIYGKLVKSSTLTNNANAMDAFWAYAASDAAYPKEIDQTIIKNDPSYRYSKRRLRVLRSSSSLGVSQWETNYVASAIAELEAYPEADLPE